MSKRILILMMWAAICLNPQVFAQPSSDAPVIIEGRTIEWTDETGEPYINNENRTLVPFRVCLSAIGCTVDWNSKSQTATARKGGLEVSVPIGRNSYIANGVEIQMDTAAVINGGRVYLPLRPLMEAFGYKVDWDSDTGSIQVSEKPDWKVPKPHQELSPDQVNGGTTGIFVRRQLGYEGFDSIEADITLPSVEKLDEGDCPYVYFGFDYQDYSGNTEGGFQYIFEPQNPMYRKWTVFLRQGGVWEWGDGIALEQDSTHHLKFSIQNISAEQGDYVIELDGNEVIRKRLSVGECRSASAKYLDTIAMSRRFDGSNSSTKTCGCKIENVTVSKCDSDSSAPFDDFQMYSEWDGNIWYGSGVCTQQYLHYDGTGSLSLYLNE